MPKWTRVRNKITGHHQSVQVIRPEHEVLKDHRAVNANGDPLPAKHNVSAPAAAADKATGDEPSGATSEPTPKATEAKPKENKS